MRNHATDIRHNSTAEGAHEFCAIAPRINGPEGSKAGDVHLLSAGVIADAGLQAGLEVPTKVLAYPW